MKKELKLSVVIPVFNEKDTVMEIIEKVRTQGIKKEIIIVDDGSRDGTRESLSKISTDDIKVVYHDKNYGKGRALRTGFAYASGDIVIVQDADLEYDPAEYPKLIEKIVEGKADVVYGTRFLGGPHRVFYFYHYLGNKIINFIANLILNTNLTDMMTCYKVFTQAALKKITLQADGFGIEAEITGEIFQKKLRVYEVPISYSGRTYQEGKKIKWKDFFVSLYWLLRVLTRKSPK